MAQAGAEAALQVMMRFTVQLGTETFPVEVTEENGCFRVASGPDSWEVDARLPQHGICSLLIGGRSYTVDVKGDPDGYVIVDVNGESYRVRVEEETRYTLRTRGGAPPERGGQVLAAPMPGKVVYLEVEVGQSVQSGDGLLILEAMKMENELKATVAGTVKEIRVQVGQTVSAGDVLLVIE
jgi:acetyl/propionyl-CoA carboxylase alpha subunit